MQETDLAKNQYESAELPPVFPGGVKARWMWMDNSLVIPYSVEPYYTGYSSPEFYKTFAVSKPIQKAELWITSLGTYEVYLNERRVSNTYCNPLWTDYRKRILVQSYDVTNRLEKGENAIHVILGDGWYRGYIIFRDRNYGDIPLKVLLELRIKYIDGTDETVLSDSSWKSGTGNIAYADYQMGERDTPTGLPTDAYFIHPVLSAYDEELNERLFAQDSPYIRVIKELPLRVLHWRNDTEVILTTDQNMSGFLSVELEELPSKTEVVLEYGEMLTEDGDVYVGNLRNARQRDFYCALGRKKELFQPHFTMHGFQYVKMTGVTKKQFSKCRLKAMVTSADCKRTGDFVSGDPNVNKLFSNIFWGQLDNFSAVPTDCPQRDERLGWTGDAQIFCRSANYNMQCREYYRKYLRDIADSQFPTGEIGDVVPLLFSPEGIVLFGRGNAAWMDAVIVIPWTLYLFYGDVETLREFYPCIKKHVDYVINASPDGLYKRADYGDWLSVKNDTPKEVVAAVYAAHDVDLMARIASVLGKTGDECYYRKKADWMKEAVNHAFVESDGKILGDSQSDYLLFLQFGLYRTAGEEEQFVRHLVRCIHENKDHLSSGFVAVAYLLPILTKYGYQKLACDILLTKTYPSWLYSVVNGATTVWERWNSYSEENGFGDEGMNSFNHYSLGSVSEWLYSGLGGIAPSESAPGFSKICINPVTDRRLQFCHVSYDSTQGMIETSWKYEGDRIRFIFCVPEGVDAEAELKDVLSFENAEMIAGEKNRFRLAPGESVFTARTPD